MENEISLENCKNRVLLLCMQYLEIWKYSLTKGKTIQYNDLYRLWLLTEVIESVPKQDEWMQLSIKVIEGLKAFIESPAFSSLGLFYGMADVGLIMNEFSDVTGQCKNFSKSISIYTLTQTYDYCTRCRKEISQLRFNHYDTISGLAGIGNFLIYYVENSEKKHRTLMHIKEYFEDLISLSVDGIPKWHIKFDNQSTLDDKQEFPNGHFNFGLSHGLAGPMFFLSNLLLHEFSGSSALRTTLQCYIDVYEKTETVIGNSIFWPAKLDYENYIKHQYSILMNYSWCYGNLSILRALYSSYLALNDYNNATRIKSILTSEICEGPCFTQLQNIVCHGNSGSLIMASLLNYESDCLLNESISKHLVRFLDSFTEKDMYNEINNSKKNGFLEGIVGILIAMNSSRKYSPALYRHLLLL